MPVRMVRTEFALLDEILRAYADTLGLDFLSYRNHCCRVLNFCLALSGDAGENISKISIAAAFHDLAIWTDHTFDYLGPSQRLARGYLDQTGNDNWCDEVEEMIGQHHKIRPYLLRPEWLVESFRKADWIDVALGSVTFGLDAAFVRDVRNAFPNAGFHKRLTVLAWQRLLRHPLSPLPMMRW